MKPRTILVLIALLFAALVVYQLIFPPPSGAPADATAALGTFVAIAAAIERFWESVFALYESFALAVGRLFGVSSKTLGWMNTELARAQQAMEDLFKEDSTKPEYQEKLLQAENRLKDAQARIEEALKLPEYTSAKKAVTLFGSLALGVAVAVAGKLQFLAAAGFPINFVPFDILVTGLLIGLGPGPLHDLIGLIKELKNAVAGVADLTRGAALKKVGESLNAERSAFRTASDEHKENPQPDRLRFERSAVRMLRPR